MDRSVVQADLSTTPTRYRLLSAVRGYCRQIDPDPTETRAAHARWVRRLVAEHAAPLTGPDAEQAYRTLAGELPNLRAGIQHDLSHHPAAALRTATALEWLWVATGTSAEGRELIRTAMTATPDTDPHAQEAGLLAQSLLSFHLGQAEQTLRLADTALELIDTDHDDHPLLAKALLCRAAGTVLAGDADTAPRDAARLAMIVDRHDTPDWLRASAWTALGAATLLAGNHTHARCLLVAARRATSATIPGQEIHRRLVQTLPPLDLAANPNTAIQETAA